ncbi:hypothetical protein ARTHRO8AJ_50052 [Arthrobacter sp. 8AJ]|nr:hypothetical protein ARTHRO8AJ_50052 [Arthrobacter sp. 8AJ]
MGASQHAAFCIGGVVGSKIIETSDYWHVHDGSTKVEPWLHRRTSPIPNARTSTCPVCSSP